MADLHSTRRREEALLSGTIHDAGHLRSPSEPLKPFVRLGRTIRKHRDGILAARRLKLSNARAEALNNKVKLIVRRAYGFHSARAALALIHLTCGPVELTLPHEPKFA